MIDSHVHLWVIVVEAGCRQWLAELDWLGLTATRRPVTRGGERCMFGSDGPVATLATTDHGHGTIRAVDGGRLSR